MDSMKLQEGQVWKQGETYLRIVHWERLSIVYKAISDLRTQAGTEHQVSKKEFCRLIRGATLMPPEEVRAARGRG
jgi:hypothetical protein